MDPVPSGPHLPPPLIQKHDCRVREIWVCMTFAFCFGLHIFLYVILKIITTHMHWAPTLWPKWCPMQLLNSMVSPALRDTTYMRTPRHTEGWAAPSQHSFISMGFKSLNSWNWPWPPHLKSQNKFVIRKRPSISNHILDAFSFTRLPFSPASFLVL